MVIPSGSVLVGLSSRKHSAVLLKVDPATDQIECVCDLDKVGHLAPFERQPKIHVTPVQDDQGWYHFFSHFGLDTHLPLHGSRIGYEGMRHWRWHPIKREAQQLGRVFDGEGAIALNSTRNGDILFVVTFPQALLLGINTRTGQVHNYGRTNGVYAPRHVLVDRWERPYVLDHRGRFWTVPPAQDMLRPLDVSLPVGSDVSGNLLAQGLVSSAELDNRSAYLVMSAWGQLYEIRFSETGNVTVSDYGRPADRVTNPSWNPPSRRVTAAGLACGPDKRIYLAVSGYNHALDPEGESYILRCDRFGEDVEIIARLDGEKISYICGSNAVDEQTGRVFFVGNHLANDSPYLIVLEPLRQNSGLDRK
jgi:hypothetical protein